METKVILQEIQKEVELESKDVEKAFLENAPLCVVCGGRQFTINTAEHVMPKIVDNEVDPSIGLVFKIVTCKNCHNCLIFNMTLKD